MSNQDRAEQIFQIANELDRLSRRLNTILTLDDDNEEIVNQAPEPEPVVADPVEPAQNHQPARALPPANLQEGQRVVVLNNYQGLRGAIGIIGAVTRFRVSVRLEGSNRIISRAHHNVRVID